jgi:hypothetical protein
VVTNATIIHRAIQTKDRLKYRKREPRSYAETAQIKIDSITNKTNQKETQSAKKSESVTPAADEKAWEARPRELHHSLATFQCAQSVRFESKNPTFTPRTRDKSTAPISVAIESTASPFQKLTARHHNPALWLNSLRHTNTQHVRNQRIPKVYTKCA